MSEIFFIHDVMNVLESSNMEQTGSCCTIAGSTLSTTERLDIQMLK